MLQFSPHLLLLLLLWSVCLVNIEYAEGRKEETEGSACRVGSEAGGAGIEP